MIDSGANFDSTGKYRYSLWRTWDKEKPKALFVMLNPSTANAETDDPTIRRCVNFAKSWDFGGLKVVNLFALVSPDPAKLLTEKNSVGENNDLVIQKESSKAAIIIAAWGAFKEAERRSEEVLKLLKYYNIYCLGTTKQGHPKHPLYLSKELKPIIFAKGESLPKGAILQNIRIKTKEENS